MSVKYYQSHNSHFNKDYERYFKVNDKKDHVVQVCTGEGDMEPTGKRAGKSYTGIYLIKRITWISNHLPVNQKTISVKPISKSLFKEKLKFTYKKLKHL